MKYETIYENICTMIREYDAATKNTDAENVIAHPEKWSINRQFPFYTSAADLLIATRAKMDTKTTSATVIAAVKRIYQNCSEGRPDMRGLFSYKDRFVICDGYRLLRLTSDISSIPHVENDFDVDGSMKKVGPTDETLTLPTVGELRAFIAATKRKNGRRTIFQPYLVDNFIYVNPQYLIDMIQALPDCTAYKPSKNSKPIYFQCPNGDDGILLPVRQPEEKYRAENLNR